MQDLLIQQSVALYRIPSGHHHFLFLFLYLFFLAGPEVQVGLSEFDDSSSDAPVSLDGHVSSNVL